MTIRQPAVAGMFYPDDPKELFALINIYLEEAKDIPLGSLRGGITPHAGYIYSGPIAGVLYRQLKTLPQKKYIVFLMGPAHHEFTSITVGDYDSFLTPLGEVPIAKDICEQLVAQNFCTNEIRPHIREHSLEVQLPFLQTVLNDFEIVPLLCGDCTADELFQVIEPYWKREDCLFIASSDLSHYLPYAQAQEIDRVSLDYITSLNIVRKDSIDACGKIPIQALMLLAQVKEAELCLLDYRNSGDTAGDKGQVVGYGALGMYKH